MYQNLVMSPVIKGNELPTLLLSPLEKDAQEFVCNAGKVPATLEMSPLAKAGDCNATNTKVPTRGEEAMDYEVPDGGWGWIVVFSTLMINLLVDGVGLAYGVLLPKFAEHFSEPRSKVSLVGSVLLGTYLCTGPLWGGLVKVYGCRAVTIVGSIVSYVAFLCGSFSPNIDVLIVIYGLVGGLGIGMMYFPSIISVSQYFDRKRSIATGIAVCGSGIGAFIFSPMIEFLSTEFNWRGILMILSGIILNGVVFGSLMRPLTNRRVEQQLQSIQTITGKVNRTIVLNNTAILSHDSHCTIIKFKKDNLSITDSNNVKDIVDKPITECAPKQQSHLFILTYVNGLIDFSLFLDVKFTFLFFGNLFVAVGIYIPFMYIFDRALLLGIPSTKAAFLLSVIGIANVVGRLAAGIISHLKSVDALVIAICSLVVATVSLFLEKFCTNYSLLASFCVVYGLCIGIFVSTGSIVVCSLLGVNRLAGAWGLLGVGRGLGSVVGPYLAGELLDSTGTYDASFYLSGSTFFLTTIFHLLTFIFVNRK